MRSPFARISGKGDWERGWKRSDWERRGLGAVGRGAFLEKRPKKVRRWEWERERREGEEDWKRGEGEEEEEVARRVRRDPVESLVAMARV